MNMNHSDPQRWTKEGRKNDRLVEVEIDQTRGGIHSPEGEAVEDNRGGQEATGDKEYQAWQARKDDG